jgi:hypothetical protein
VGREDKWLPGAVPQLVEEGRARMVELKRQLHVHVMRSKNPKGFSAFGLMFNGLSIEVYAIVFSPDNFFL